jgi:ApbE superfamily uncharacterized protein (UPF0280 family)
MPYRRRSYRSAVRADGLVPFTIRMGQSHLMILAERDLRDRARDSLRRVRSELQAYCRRDRAFAEAMKPYDVGDDAPDVVRRMAVAARVADVGPMAAVAGAVAQTVGVALDDVSSEVVVENGGDVYMRITRPRTVGVFAGGSRLSGAVAITIRAEETPLGVCCSSATVGPSISFGLADAAVVVAGDTALADAVATGLGNRVRSVGDIEAALAWALSRQGVRGALVVLGEAFGAQGAITLAAT